MIASAGIGMAEVIPFAAVTDGLGRDSAFLGILSACHGAGAIVAGLAIPRLIAARGEIVAMSAAAAAGAVGMVLFALPARSACWPPRRCSAPAWPAPWWRGSRTSSGARRTSCAAAPWRRPRCC